MTLNIEQVNIINLHPHNKNAKKHDERQIQKIAASISAFKFNSPILCDENGEIIAGHGRFEAAKLLGMKEVPCIRLSHLSKTQKRAYRLADNRLAELGKWDEDILKIELSELEAIADFEIELTGFDSVMTDVLTEDKEPDPKLDILPPFIPDGEIISKHGDLWILDDKHRLYCGNSLNEESFKTLMEDRKAQLVFQDPPFNVKIQGHVGGSGKIKHQEFAFASGEMSPQEFIEFLKTNFTLCAKYSKDGSLNMNFIDHRHCFELITAANAIFTSYVNLCVWNKMVGGMGSLWRSQHELIFVFKNGKNSHVNNVELGSNNRYRTNVWDFKGPNSFGKEKKNLYLHPTCKPVSLLVSAILDVSNRGDIVLDSFFGSGSYLLASEKSKRIFCGIEYEGRYVDTAIRRYLSAFKGQAIRTSDGRNYNELLKERTAINNGKSHD